MSRAALSCALIAAGVMHPAVCAAVIGDGFSDEAHKLIAAARDEVVSGHTAEAVRLYRQALALDRSNVTVRRELARLLTRIEATRAEAQILYRDAVMLAPFDASLAVERADYLVALGEVSDAILEYRRAFELNPELQAALHGYSRQVRLNGGTGATMERTRKKLIASPDELAPRLLYAELLLNDGRFNEARGHFMVARLAAPDSGAALRGIVRSCLLAANFDCAAAQLAPLAVRSASFSQVLAQRARLLLASGRPDAALLTLGASRSGAAWEKLEDTETLDLLADCYRARGDARNERAALERVLRLPGATDAVGKLERLARARFEAGEVPAARVALDELAQVDPGNAVGRVGRSLLLATDSEQAPTILKAKAGQDSLLGVHNARLNRSEQSGDWRPPQNAAARRVARARDEGEAALFWRQPKRAIAFLRVALAAEPSSPGLQLTLGQALLQNGDASGAIKQLINLTLEGGKTRLDALLLHAQALELLHDPAGALNLYEYILELHPAHIPALQGQIRSYEQMNKAGRAAALLSQLTRLAPEETSVKTHLLSSLNSLGRGATTMPESANSSPATGVTRSPDGDREPRPRPKNIYSQSQVEALLDAGDIIRVKNSESAFVEPFKLDIEGRLRLDARTLIDARCRTAKELSEMIAKSQNLSTQNAFEVEVVEFQSAPIKVAGAVSSPASFYLTSPLDVPHSLQLAGGTGERAGDTFFVLRGINACQGDSTGSEMVRELKPQLSTYYQGAAVDEQATRLTPPLAPGTLVYVPDRNTVYIAGEVMRPSILAVPAEGLKLLDAVRQAGGVTGVARRDQIRLLRLLPDKISYQEFILNLDEIERKQVGDVILRADDIVEITAIGANDARMAAFAQLLEHLAFGQPPRTGGTALSVSK